MPKAKAKSSKMVGLPPGTLVHIGEERKDKVKITVIDYSEGQFVEKVVNDANECFVYRDQPTTTWINVDGLHQMDIIEKIGECFKLHPLLMEDLVDTNQRPKMEDYDDYIFMVLKMLYHGKEKNDIVVEHVGIVLGKNYVISFQEEAGEDVFDRIRDRLRNNRGKIRKTGADYLAYSLIDSIVDNYFLILERFGEKIEFLDEELVKNPKPDILRNIHEMKRSMIYLRKSVWPLREVVGGIQRTGSALISNNTRLYLRDVYDHTIQVIDTMETYRDILAGMIDIYLSSVSYKLNEIMKVLTVISTVFIPLTFIASIYGMNFKHMPEIGWYWGYPTVLFIMITIAIGMIVYFTRKKWI